MNIVEFVGSLQNMFQNQLNIANKYKIITNKKPTPPHQ